ncbi:gamma-glutamyltransferase [Blastopirellula retiformator]|uniref:Glutathione hydrolase proenzyme n=1 Tax=Blastopirellula retiformator TaxID=2527970 RepID=A0A5C5V9N3_9BACT|nr:gamma-glutamyltransferase [Blastopirellula retiformator]TWT34442.1 Gamma-glutamyltranspeptidase precursor [Blastopirellula retiformator]
MKSPATIRRPYCRPLLYVGLIACTLLLLPLQSLHAQSAPTRPPRDSAKVVTGNRGVVVAETQLASDIGCQILAKGGNAVDAAVGVAFALQVSWPEAGNIGGGGFMMIAPPEEEVVCVNYREKAPAAVDPFSFADWKQHRHARMAGVPGTVRGLALAHETYGSLPWREVIAPSIALARDGLVVDPHLAFSLNSVLRLKSVRTESRFDEFRRVYGHPDQRPWQAGDRLLQPDLAQTLTSIALQGPAAFYEGEIAKKIVTEMKRSDGLITAQDLQGYQPQLLPAVAGDVGPYTVYGAPPPASGGTIVLLQLRMIEALRFSADKNGPYWTGDQVHLLVEAMRRGFRERAAWLGDPNYVAIPPHLLTPEHARRLASSIDVDKATSSEEIAGSIPLSEGPYESAETTHFSVVDTNGLAVSNTYTLEGTFGCRIVVPGAGFVLNNEMGDFNWYPGYTDRNGKIGTTPNQLAPGKRMLSSQSPTIVRENGKLKLVVGSPGGRTIINTVTEILAQTLLLDRPLETAISGPRFHHQWFPDEIRFETDDQGVFTAMQEELTAKGHRIAEREADWRQGSAHGIVVDLPSGEATGVADWRRGGGASSVASKP